MKYEELCKYYEKIEKTTKRKEMTMYLVSLFKNADPDEIEKIVYLTQGKLHPDWMGLPEIGIAEKLAIKAISSATGISEEIINEKYSKTGDLGLVAEELMHQKQQMTLFYEPLTVLKVYETLDRIANATGEGATSFRVRTLSGLLSNATPLEAKYIIRTVTGKLRLGIAEMTILDALAIMSGSQSMRELIERAYNITSDLGYVAKILKKEGIAGLEKLHVAVGRPIRMMLAQRAVTSEEILERMGGPGWSEYKLDGERFQCHKSGNNVVIYSRRLENITSMYPDAAELIKKYVKANDAVVEGEAVPINPNTGEILPFQELMHRRRKYDIEIMMQKIPVSIFLFDCLYYDGNDLTNSPFIVRSQKLRELVEQNERISPVPYLLTNDPAHLDDFFHESLGLGNEGLVIKAIRTDSIYRAGARSWLWIKLKESYRSKMVEPVDLVVVGAFYGKGRRSGSYGALLVAVYNPANDCFETICKVGSGFTDEDLDKLPSMFEKYKVDKKPENVISKMEADVWFEPKIVIEVIGDEITLSPVHTCAFGKIEKNVGLAIRFPRFTGRWRFDKSPKEVTTTDEIIEIYKLQLKKIA
ncbi:MAG: ATP-dependent DNA ligase [Candidatus Asgardarchaeia archaeon]